MISPLIAELASVSRSIEGIGCKSSLNSLKDFCELTDKCIAKMLIRMDPSILYTGSERQVRHTNESFRAVDHPFFVVGPVVGGQVCLRFLH